MPPMHPVEPPMIRAILMLFCSDSNSSTPFLQICVHYYIATCAFLVLCFNIIIFVLQVRKVNRWPMPQNEATENPQVFTRF